MDLYNQVAQASAKQITEAYSSSFSKAASLFDSSIRQHIYNIYGLVRLADEIVDTYSGPNQLALLDNLEAETYQSLESGYSPNIIVQAFSITARDFTIGQDLIGPFFGSMRTDSLGNYTPDMYEAYIDGSARVVGLMCLRVFVGGDSVAYDRLEPGARALGAAFQKINFLRDMAADHELLQRYYFPQGNFESFDADTKAAIVSDIKQDLAVALPTIRQLPDSSRRAVRLAYDYFANLLLLLDQATAASIKQQRLGLSKSKKLQLYAAVKLRIVA